MCSCVSRSTWCVYCTAVIKDLPLHKMCQDVLLQISHSLTHSKLVFVLESECSGNLIPDTAVKLLPGASLRGRLPPAALAHKETTEQNKVNEADRSMIRCTLTTCKCQELHAPETQSGSRRHASNERVCIVFRLEVNTGTFFFFWRASVRPVLMPVRFVSLRFVWFSQLVVFLTRNAVDSVERFSE